MINAKWDITYKCNLNCAHCINGEKLWKVDGELNLDEIKMVVKNLSHKISYLHILGGEPLAREDFSDILILLDKYDLNFGFNTNGLKLYDEKLRESLIRNKNFKNIIFSIEGPNAEINDSIRGKNVFRHIVPNLEAMTCLKKERKRNDLTITVNTVLSKKNLNYIDDMIDFCIEKGVDEFNILQFIVEGNAKKDDESITMKDELNIIELIADRYDQVKDRLKVVPRFTTPLAKEYVQKVLKKNFPIHTQLCGAGSEFVYIDNKGCLFPCDKVKSRLFTDDEDASLVKNEFWGVLAKDNYNEIFNMTENKGSYNKIFPCNECPMLNKYCTPCPLSTNFKDGFCVENCVYFNRKIKEIDGYVYDTKTN